MKKLTRMLVIGGLAGTALGAGVVEGAVSVHAPGESNLTYLFAAFTVTWGALFAYLFYMAGRQRELRREVEALRRALREKEEA